MDLSPEGARRPDAPRYAGFWIRAFANVLDVLLLAALNSALVLAWTTAEAPPAPSHGIGSVSAGSSVAVAELAMILPTLVLAGFSLFKRATPGKMMCGLCILDAAGGGRPSAWQFVGRYLVGVVVASLAGVGYLWIAIDPRKQGWHDKVARTLVVHRERAA